MIFSPAETLPRKQLLALQGERLAALVAYAADRVPMYRERMATIGLKPSKIKHARDITMLPFTTKSDLRDNYPFGLFAVPRTKVARIHASSGTTGKPTVVGYTKNDIKMWAEVCARCFALSGARRGDMFQNAYGYGLFTGGLGMHYGAERFGCTVVPVSGGNTARQIMLMQDFGTRIMACTPSYALTIADELLRAGIDRSALKLSTFIMGAEPWTTAMRTELEAKLNVHAVNIYGLSEVIGPGVSNECVEAKDGSHIFEDHFLAEILHPETHEPLPDGEVGEIVFTTLTKEAMPVIRYRTGDLCSINREKCICGRTHARMSNIVGRTDDMLIIRGVNVFPSQIEAALVQKQHLTPHYFLLLSRTGRNDEMEVQIEVSEQFHTDLGPERFAHPDTVAVHALHAEASKALAEALGLNARVTLVAPGKTPRSDGGKLKRVRDERKLSG